MAERNAARVTEARDDLRQMIGFSAADDIWRGKTLDSLLAEVRTCRACADVLPFGPRPVVRLSTTARILVSSQAPGTKVHASGIPFSDASGDRRHWAAQSPRFNADVLPVLA